MAEWSLALVLGTSHLDGVGSNPTAAKLFFLKFLFSIKLKTFFTCNKVAFSLNFSYY